MASLQKTDTISIIIASIIGITFFGLSLSVFKNLDANCPSSIIRNGWALIQAIGACMVAAGVSYFICVLFGGRCYENVDYVRTSEIYIAIFGFFFLVVLGICASMLKDYKDLKESEKDNCDDKSNTTQKSTIFITIISGLGLIFSIGYFIKLRLEENKELAGI